MNLLGNLIWLLFGGLLAALGYVIGGFVLCVTIIGIPWGLQCFKIAAVVLWPFGKKIVPKAGRQRMPESVLQYYLANIWWLVYCSCSPGICGHLIYYHNWYSFCPSAFEINGAFPVAL